MRKHKIPYFNKCRQIEKEDFYKFDFIFGMDEGNINALLKLAPQDSTAKISLLGEFDPNGERIIRDPFFVSIKLVIHNLEFPLHIIF